LSVKNETVLVVVSAGGHLTQALCATSTIDKIVLVSTVPIANERIRKLYRIIDTQFNPLVHFINAILSMYIIIRERPRAVFSTGGPLVLPFALLCKVLPVKYVHLDTLSRVIELSNTVKFLKKYNLFDELYCQWEGIAAKNGIEYIGKSFDMSERGNEGINQLPRAEVANILVTTGTCEYPFTRLAEMLYSHPLYQHPNVRWTIQTRGNKLDVLPRNGEVVELITRQEMEELILNSHYVISHCGVGSINLMLTYQKMATFVPRVAEFGEFSDDHQLQIANEISGSRFQVVKPGEQLPALTFEELIAVDRISDPVDITNYDLANSIKEKLLGDA